MFPKRVLTRTSGAFEGSVGAAAGAGCATGSGCAAGETTVFSAVALLELLQPEALQNTKRAAQPMSAMESLFIASIFEATKVVKESELRDTFSTRHFV